MKNIKIIINKTDIFRDVSLNSEYTGAKSDSEQDIYARVATIEEDDALLSKLWGQTCGDIIDRLRGFISDSSASDSELKLTLEVSGAFDDTLTQSVIDDLNIACSAGVTARWFRFTFPALCNEWETLALASLDKALAKICHRRPPQRR